MAHVALDGHWLRVNDRLAAILGYSREELEQLTFQQITYPEDLAADEVLVADLLAGRERAYQMEKRYVRKDGGIVWADLTVSLVRDDNGQPLYFVSVIEDIDARKRAEHERDEQLETASALQRAADALNEWTELDPLLRGLSETLRAATRHSRVVIALLTPDRSHVRVVAAAGESPLPIGEVVPWSELSPQVREVLSEGTTYLADHDRLPPAERAFSAHMASRLTLLVPLVRAGVVLGHIAVDEPGERREFTESEIRIVEGIASQAAVAIENARLFHNERRGAARARALAEMSAALVSTPDVHEALPAVLGRAGEELGAAGVALLVREGAAWLVRHAWGGQAAVVGTRYPLDGLPSHAKVLETRGPNFVGDVETSEGVNRELAREIGYRALAIYPMLFRGEVIGTLAFSYAQPVVSFAEDDSTFMARTAFIVSSALQNARLFQELENELVRRRLLQDVALAGASGLEIGALARRMLKAIERHLGLQAGDIRLLSRDRSRLRLLESVGWSEPVRQQLADVPLADVGWMASRALREGRGLTHEDEEPPTPEREALLRDAGVLDSRYIALPLRFGDETLGVMSLTFRGRHPFRRQELELFDALGGIVSQSIANARAFEAERETSSLAAALNRINESVHSTLDFEEIMTRVVVEVAQALGVDASAIHMHRQGYWEFTYGHGMPEGLRRLQLSDDEARLSMNVLTSRESLVANDVLHDPRANVRLMERFDITALVAVPLTVRGDVIGVLFAGCLGARAGFTERQVDFMQKAASTLALALENARLYATERDIADRLQEALLSLPRDLPGLEFAHAYHSATEAARVGGDFYDIFAIGNDLVGITIGDVAGKGLDAAVLTSLVKNAIRAHASEKGATPARILGLTNDVVYGATSSESFVTVFFGVLDCRDGTLVYANAGHTAAAVLHFDGSVGTMAATGPILGAFAHVGFEQQRLCLERDELMFLYTDGLTEARRDGRLFGEEALLHLLERFKQATPARVVGGVIDEVLAYTGGRLSDDLALLALRWVADGSRQLTQQKLEL